MSTNINHNEIPDAGALEKLANQFFSELPGDFLSGLSASKSSSTLRDPLLQHGDQVDLAKPQTSLHDPHFAGNGKIPQSAAGNGISTTSPSQPNRADYSKDYGQPQTSLPDPHFAGQGINPKSEAGNGVSPSGNIPGNAGNNNVIDLTENGRFMPDSQYAGKGINPQSVAGSGVSPSYQNSVQDINLNQAYTQIPNYQAASGNGFGSSPLSGSGISPTAPLTLSKGGYGGYTPYLEQANQPKNANPLASHQLPYTSEQPFESQLREALKSANANAFKSQIPVNNGAVLNPASFYFLTNEGSSHAANATPAFPTQGKGITTLVSPPFDANIVKKDFPILSETVNGKPLIWLDNAATTQKPQSVIDRISYFYQHENSNIHRAAHELAARATDAYEGARQKVQQFINAASINEIIFVRGATEAINLVAKTWGAQNLRAGDEILVSNLEHHANIVPWQQLAAKKGLKIRVIPVDEDGQILLDEYAKLLGPKTKLVAFTQVSNALGTVTPAHQMAAMAKSAGAMVLIDGAQSVSHMRVDVQSLNCDWFVFSGHKVFGPTGIGVVYGKEDLLNQTQPWQGGGNMIKDVTFEYTQYHDAPGRFEAGTGNIADAVGLGAAIDYVNKLGIDNINQYEHYLLLYATKLLKEVPGLRLIGTAADKASVMSFTLEGFRTEEVGAALNEQGIAVRSGHHCAQPILRRFGVEATVRPSLAFYNTCSDIDTLVETLFRLKGGYRK